MSWGRRVLKQFNYINKKKEKENWHKCSDKVHCMKTLQITGFEGAYNIGQTLLNRGVQLEFLLDEGLTVVDTTAMDGLTTPAAL